MNTNPEKRFRVEDIRKHKWWNLGSTQKSYSHGIIVGYNRIPIDDVVLDAVVSLGFDQDFSRKCIEANRHNEVTTTYYLLLKKYVRNGGVSKTYLNSKHFDPTLIEPLKKKILGFENSPLLKDKFDERPSKSQPKISSSNPTGQYYLEKSLKEKKSESLNKNHRTLMTPNQRLARSIEHNQPKDAINKTITRKPRISKHEGYSFEKDLINRKYR